MVHRILQVIDLALRKSYGSIGTLGGKVGFFGTSPVTQPTALTTQLTQLSGPGAVPGTADYAIQALTSTTPFGFVSADEGETVVSVVENLQTRVSELESKLQSLGLLV